jgi:hypothetical protein
VNSDPEFVSNILFTDEARFTRDGVVNVHNTHVYAHENPHEIIAGHHQQQWGINLWAGIVGGHLIGPYMLEGNLNASKYLAFLQEVLPGLLEDVPLQTRREMWYQHDGAPPHFGTQVRDHLNSVYPGKWIGRGGPVGWPARSPDLTPPDFFLWGHLKEVVYSLGPPASPEEFMSRIQAAVTTIDGNMLQRVQQNIMKRTRACIQMNGGHLEHLL